MVGIDFTDTIVVRRVTEKGTKIIEEKIKVANWAGKDFKKYEKKLRELAGDRGLASCKGTQTLRIKQMRETTIPDVSGLLMSTGRGTGLRIG
ncbi:MAG: hypothetical protein WD650_03005 [Nitrosopumilaceae archaeon]